MVGAGAFNPKDQVTINGQAISLAQYASRLNLKLLRPSDFNEKLRERSVDKRVTVQRVCRTCSNEKQVRKQLDAIWERPSRADETLEALNRTNQGLYKFEIAMHTEQEPEIH